jgi:hypothetical protein
MKSLLKGGGGRRLGMIWILFSVCTNIYFFQIQTSELFGLKDKIKICEIIIQNLSVRVLLFFFIFFHIYGLLVHPTNLISIDKCVELAMYVSVNGLSNQY